MYITQRNLTCIYFIIAIQYLLLVYQHHKHLIDVFAYVPKTYTYLQICFTSLLYPNNYS